jgi:mannosyltransferase
LSRRLLVGVIAVVVAIGVAMRFASTSHLWLDEALTVNIARLPLRDLPAALRRDGSPPLYYAMLHLWMRVFGTGDVAVRALPGLFGVISIPLAYLCGGGLRGAGFRNQSRTFDRTAAVTTMLVVATSPWAIRYSTENRPYSLAIMLVLLGVLALTGAMRSPTLGPLVAVAAVTAALVYTTYWSFFLLAVVAVLLIIRWFRAARSERNATLRLLLAIAAGGVLLVPWLPSLATQLKHTGTPWSRGPKPIVLVTTITQFGGSNFLAARFVTVIFVAMALIALVGIAIPRIAPPAEGGGTRRVRVVFAIGAATLLIGVGEAMVSNTAYQVRYAAVVFPFAVLVLGAVLLEPKVRVAVMAVFVVLSLVAAQHWITEERTESPLAAAYLNEKALTTRRCGSLECARPGDVVVYCPDQVGPATARYIRTSLELRQYTFPSFGDPRFVNWTDYAKRNEAADPLDFAREIRAHARHNTIWYVWSPGYLTYGLKCEALLTDLGLGRPPSRTVVPIRGKIEHVALVEYAPAP